MSIWLLCSPPSCRSYVISLDTSTMLIWLLHSPPSRRLYVISFDVCSMSIWLLGSPLSCRLYVISFDTSTTSIWLLHSRRSYRKYVMSFDISRMSIWLLHSSPATDCTWCRLISAQCRSDCCIFPLLQTVRDFSLCLHNGDLTAVFLPSNRPCVVSLLISADCRSDCCILTAPTESPWSLLMSVEYLYDRCILPLLQKVCDVVWYLQNIDLTAAFSPPAGSTWSLLIPLQCQPECCISPPLL